MNELRYAKDLADQAALFGKRIEGLLAIVEDLQSRFGVSAAGSRPSVAEALISSVECSPSETMSVTEPSGSQAGADACADVGLGVDPSSTTQPLSAGAARPTSADLVSAKADPREGAGGARPTSADLVWSKADPREGIEKEGRHEDDFIAVRPRRHRHRANHRGRDRDNSISESGASSTTLRGAQRVEIKAFYVGGVSPDCSAADVIGYCRRRRVLATACNLLSFQIGGT